MYNNNNRTPYCTNCGLNGHIFRNCQSPITSYGIIAIRFLNDNNTSSLFSNSNMLTHNSASIEFLLIKRKDSLSFIEFVRGKYSQYDTEYISKNLRGMTKIEQQRVLVSTFDELWAHIWGKNPISLSHKNDYESCKKRFSVMKDIIPFLIRENPSSWDEPEWGFPKGRRNPHEMDINCAIREFQEETGIKRNDFSVIQNMNYISETFFGSNNIHYCHKYYIAICNKSTHVEMNMNNHHMVSEIGEIKWCTINEAISKIRPDNIEKREILLKAAKIIRDFYPIHTHNQSTYSMF